MIPQIMKGWVVAAIWILTTTQLYAQSQKSYQSLGQLGDSLYEAKNFQQAGKVYLAMADIAEFKNEKAGSLYNAACCLSLAGKKDSAFIILKRAIELGYNDKSHILVDSDLVNLHSDPLWDKTTKDIKDNKKAANEDPTKAEFITDDVHRFWSAYDKALKDTAHFKAIMTLDYFDKASVGMDDYMSLKVSSINFFVDHIRSAPKFYAAIRKNSLAVDDFKPVFVSSFRKMKTIYPAARFPDVYFVIGAFSSGGTVSDAGLLIGVNQMCDADGVPLDELDFRLRTRLNKFNTLPNIIAHELIHFQQKGMKNDTTTLSQVIHEGMADFMGELISGSTANPRLYEWAKGKEKAIWQKFVQDMYFNRYDNWIANSKDATPDNLPDQGYWIGYQICSSYYEHAPDKSKAIAEMLNIQDYKAFLEKSKWEEKLANLK